MFRFVIISLALTGLACSGLVTNGEEKNDPDIEIVEYSFNESESEISTKITGFTSISGYTKRSEQNHISLSKNLSHIVFALNKYGKPVFISQPDQKNEIIFDTYHTALTLVSIFAVDFIPDSRTNIENKIISHKKFNDLVQAINTSLRTTSSFIDNSEISDMISTINEDLRVQYFTLKPIEHPVEIEKNITKNDFLINYSKLPFQLTNKNLVTNQITKKGLFPGQILDSESEYKESTYRTNIPLNEGANFLSIYNSQESEIARFKKTAKDVILKLQTVLKLTNHSEKELIDLLDNLFNSEMRIQINSKKEHIEIVLENLEGKKDLVKNYLFSQLVDYNLRREEVHQYFDLMNVLLRIQKKEAIIFSDDTYYHDLNINQDFEKQKTVCIQNGDPVACNITSDEITYSVGTSGCRDDEFEIKFGSRFYAPYGLDSGSKLKIEWEYENGRSGFWLIPYSDSKEKVSGLNSTIGCFNFGDKEKLILREQVVDHLGNRGNISSIEIKKPKMKSVSNNSFKENALLASN